jgi:HK97 family phage prohead protease
MTTKPKPIKQRMTFATSSPNLKMSAPSDKSAPGSIATLKGTALVWNELSSDRGGYKVRLMPDSATFTEPTFALVQHNFSAVIGNTANNSLRMSATDNGYDVEIDIPDTTTGKDTKTLIEGGYIAGMSFTMANGFEESFPTTENGENIVNATKYTVDEVTVCANPAFTATTIEVAVDPFTPDSEDDEDDSDSDSDGSDRVQSSDATKEQSEQMMKWNKYRLDMYSA